MSDTLVSETMVAGSEETAPTMMFKPMNDIQARLGKVIVSANLFFGGQLSKLLLFISLHIFHVLIN